MDKLNSKQHVISGKRPFDHLVKIKTESNSWGILKTFIIFLLFLIEIAFMVLQGLYFVNLVNYYTAFAIIITFASCIYVLSSNKNSQSKAVWIMFLVVFFYFGYIIFWLSDEHVFFRSKGKRYQKIFERSEIFEPEGNTKKISNKEVKQNVNYLQKVGSFANFSDTRGKYFSSGTTLFDEILKKISEAKKYIFIEFYIISDGVLLSRLEKILTKKCKEGVEVRIIFDDMGSYRTFSYKTRKRLKSAGIKICGFNQLISWFSFGLNYRDHRKIVVIDGKVGFTGGANLSDEYTNNKRMHGYWKDSGIMIEGAAVDGLTMIFLRQWEFVSKNQTNYLDYLGLSEKFENDAVYIPFADGLEYKSNIAKSVFANMISGANERLYIMTPYFIVDDVILELIKNKALSGVDVRLILPAVPDKKTVYRVTRNTAEKLISSGVKVYTMNHSFVHSKVILTENSCVVGTINFDLRSFYQQFENAVFTDDIEIIKAVWQDFENVIKVSTLITDANSTRKKLKNRIISGLLGIVSPFM